MALEQFSIVLGVVVGFWTGFVTRSSVCLLSLLAYLLSQLSTVPSSASWRIPLGVQLLPGIVLGLGCLFLPPSPRLLVLHGQYEDALKSLARLRQRPSGDISLQVLLPWCLVS
jgi:Sugar (and other) transporter